MHIALAFPCVGTVANERTTTQGRDQLPLRGQHRDCVVRRTDFPFNAGFMADTPWQI